MKLSPENFKNIPAFYLHQVMMGSGSLLTKGKEIVLILPCYENRLSCGCAGSKAYRFTDKKGKFKYEEIHKKDKDYEDFEYHLMPFQNKEWDEYWEDYYKKNPHERPILVKNS